MEPFLKLIQEGLKVLGSKRGIVYVATSPAGHKEGFIS